MTLAAASGQPLFIVEGLLGGNADINRVAGSCRDISLALEVEGVDAMTGMLR